MTATESGSAENPRSGATENSHSASAERPDSAPNFERTRFGAVAALLTGVAFVAVAGLPGLAAAALVGVGWYASPTVAFALGQIALVAVMPDNLLALAAVEVGLFGVLLAPAMTLDKPAVPVALGVGAALVGGTLAWASASARSLIGLPTAAALLVVAFAFAAYVLNRYQLLTLGSELERNDGNGPKPGESRE